MGKPGAKRKWLDADLDQLRQLAADGLSASKIGEIMGKTRCAIISRLHHIGIHRGNNFQHPAGAAYQTGIPVHEQRQKPKPKPLPRRVKRKTKPIPPNRRPVRIVFNGKPAALWKTHECGCKFPFLPDELKANGLRPVIRRGQRMVVYCNAPQITGSSYCAVHHAICYQARSSAPDTP